VLRSNHSEGSLPRSIILQHPRKLMFGLDTLFTPAMIAALVAIIIVGAIKHGAIGFGFPLISTPLIALLIDVKTAVLITVVPNIAVNAVSILRGGNWRESIGKHWPLAIWVALGTMVGTRVLLVAPPELLQVILAAMIVVFLVQAKIRQFDWAWISRRPFVSGAAFGVVAGLFSGAVNVGAPPLLIYLMMLGLPPVALTQILNLCFIAGKTTQAATLSLAGPGSLPLLIASLPLTILAIATLLLGIQLQKRMSDALYFKILRVTLATFVILLIGQAAIELARRFHLGSGYLGT
jgi:uncharacterized membrane protein YfcA